MVLEGGILPSLELSLLSDSAVKLLDHLPEVVFAHINNAHFAFGVLLRIARVRGIDHNGLAELAPDRARWRFRRIRRTKHIPDLADGFDAFINHGNAFFGAGFVGFSKRAFRGSLPRHETDDVVELLVAENRAEHIAELLFDRQRNRKPEF